MKTLKKTFAVLLVLVTMLSLVPFVSASNFDDDDKINYGEAVDVLEGIGVVDGFPDGTFDPQAGVTRAQAAAIITRLMLSRSRADALPDAPTGFKDCDGVSGVGFAIKYIRYCASQGIIVGYPNGNFGPNDPVTASQFAVMIMRALGIGETDRYVGNDWQMYAILDGMDSGILDNVKDEVDYTKAANREETCQYAFNGLLYSPEGDEDQIYGISKWGDDNKPVYGWINVPSKSKDSVWGKVYKKLYRYNDYETADGKDDYGRPALTWKYGDDKDTIHSAALTPIKTYNTFVSQDDLYKLIGNKEKLDISSTVNQAGSQEAATLTSLKGKDDAISTYVFTIDEPNKGRGIITEIYEYKDDNYMAVVIKPEFGKVAIKDTKATSSKGAFSTYSIVNGPTIDGKPVNGGVLFTSHVDEDEEEDTLVFHGEVKKDDMVLYYHTKSDFHMEAVGVLTGKVTNATSSGEYTIDSNKYKLAYASGMDAEDEDITPNKDDDKSFYIDKFNNILGIKEGAADPVQLALVVSFNSYSELDGNKVVTKHTADIVGLDGKIATVATKEAETKKTGRVGKVCSYEINSGSYEFTPTVGEAKYDHYKIREKVDDIENGTKTLLPATFTSLVTLVSDTTKFVVVNYNDDDEPDGTVTLYTGFSRVPEFAGLKETTAVSYDEDKEADSIAEIVYIYDRDASAKTEELIYVLGTYNRDANGYAVDIIKEGEITTVTVNSGSRSTLTNKAGSLLEKLRVVSGNIPADNQPVAVVTKELKSIQNNGRLLMINGSYTGYEINNDVPVYVIEVPGVKYADATGEALTAADFTDATDYTNAQYHLVLDSGKTKVTAVYIISTT